MWSGAGLGLRLLERREARQGGAPPTTQITQYVKSTNQREDVIRSVTLKFNKAWRQTTERDICSLSWWDSRCRQVSSWGQVSVQWAGQPWSRFSKRHNYVHYTGYQVHPVCGRGYTALSQERRGPTVPLGESHRQKECGRPLGVQGTSGGGEQACDPKTLQGHPMRV